MALADGSVVKVDAVSKGPKSVEPADALHQSGYLARFAAAVCTATMFLDMGDFGLIAADLPSTASDDLPSVGSDAPA